MLAAGTKFALQLWKNTSCHLWHLHLFHLNFHATFAPRQNYKPGVEKPEHRIAINAIVSVVREASLAVLWECLVLEGGWGGQTSEMIQRLCMGCRRETSELLLPTNGENVRNESPVQLCKQRQRRWEPYRSSLNTHRRNGRWQLKLAKLIWKMCWNENHFTFEAIWSGHRFMSNLHIEVKQQYFNYFYTEINKNNAQRFNSLKCKAIFCVLIRC